MQPGSEFHKAELETLWRRRVQVARAEYERAEDAVLDTLERFRNRSLPDADGLLALKEAAEHERVSLLQYMRVLRILYDLVVYDKMPPHE